MLGVLRHFFLPHHTNNHRAKLLHLDALCVYVILLVLFNLTVRVGHHEIPDILGYATDIHVEQLLSMTNNKRAEAGLPPLTYNAQLAQAAAGKAADMFAKGYWAHVSPDGKTPWEFIKGAGYSYSVAGENLAKNFQNSGGVVDAWMGSPSHRENIMKSNYKEVGFAVVNGVLNGEETTLVVQMFGTAANNQVASAPKPQTIVKTVNAQEPTVTPRPTTVETPEPTATEPTDTPVPTPTEEPTPTPEEIEITQVAAVAQTPPPSLPGSMYLSAYRNPLIDIPTLTRDVTMAFAGFMIGLLVIDVWHMTRRKTVRAAGHPIAHIAFLAALLLGISAILPGSIL